MVAIAAWLAARQAEGTLRRLVGLDHLGHGRVRLTGTAGPMLLDFSSNDYLALSEHPALIAAASEALRRYGTGAGAARLMSGNFPVHQELEAAVAALKGQEAALLFGSGYAANVGTIAALVGRDDIIFTDRLNHASIYDGCRLAGARLARFRHNDLDHLEELLASRRGKGTALIVAESLYSMDGDRAPLRELAGLKERHGCLLMVDEAHATGVFGMGGGGIIEEEGLTGRVDLAMGTFGKALGSYGAYVAASRQMIEFLVNRARSFVFSTALPPAVAAASLAAVRLIREEPGLRQELHSRVALFKEALRQGGITADLGPSQIIPLQVGESTAAVAVAERLREHGLFVPAVRPPTVPEGTARLRFSVTRHLGEADLKEAALAVCNVVNP
ncbi:MAG: 8-amino-7-oxononanoate synthase [Thermodesulfobacteriota bacterium]